MGKHSVSLQFGLVLDNVLVSGATDAEGLCWEKLGAVACLACD